MYANMVTAARQRGALCAQVMAKIRNRVLRSATGPERHFTQTALRLELRGEPTLRWTSQIGRL